jgi:hypothetical protein
LGFVYVPGSILRVLRISTGRRDCLRKTFYNVSVFSNDIAPSYPSHTSNPPLSRAGLAPLFKSAAGEHGAERKIIGKIKPGVKKKQTRREDTEDTRREETMRGDTRREKNASQKKNFRSANIGPEIEGGFFLTSPSSHHPSHFSPLPAALLAVSRRLSCHL